MSELRSKSRRTCSSCGANDPKWLVAYRYDPTEIAGRLLVYCDVCRGRGEGKYSLVLPTVVLDENPDLIMTLLYQCEVTKSDPDIAREVIGVSKGPWLSTAKRLLKDPDSNQ